MVSAKRIALALALVTTCAVPASAGDLCDTLEASRSGNSKLFAVTMTRFAGIFRAGDCAVEDFGVRCVRIYDAAGATELFGSSSGMVIATTFGGSLQQCGFSLDSEYVNTTSEGTEFTLEYYDDDVNGAVWVLVATMNDGNYRVTVDFEK